MIKSIENKANKLRMLGNKVVVHNNVILASGNTDLDGYTTLTIYIEIDGISFNLGSVPRLDQLIPPLTKVIVKGAGKPGKLKFGGRPGVAELTNNIVHLTLDIDTSHMYDMTSMFNYLTGLRAIEFIRFDTSNVCKMSYMFNNCCSLRHINLSNFNTSKVIDMSRMFADCKQLDSLDLSGFDTSNVIKMDQMFKGCEIAKPINISGFNTSQVVNMEGMFADCKLVQHLQVENFDVKKVENMSQMFDGCLSLNQLNLRKWNTPKLKQTEMMFLDCNSLTSIDISSFTLTEVESVNHMFSGCIRLKQIKFPPIERFKWNKVKAINGLFYNCISIEEVNLAGFEGKEIDSINTMFLSCEQLWSCSMPDFNPSHNIVAHNTFEGCNNFSYLDIRGVDLIKITDTNGFISSKQKVTIVIGNDNSTESINGSEFSHKYSLYQSDNSLPFKKLALLAHTKHNKPITVNCIDITSEVFDYISQAEQKQPLHTIFSSIQAPQSIKILYHLGGV